jgi:hypothetical protein
VRSIKVIRIDGYVTESKLSKALQQLLPDVWMVFVAKTEYRWNMAYEIDGKVTVVEFDDDEHYRHSLQIKRDRAKDEIAKTQNYRVVRFPYWIQLDNLTLKHYFGLEAQVEQSFPHGFITTKFFPASFCELGVERFRAELLAIPVSVREAVVSSLQERIEEHGLRYVLPTSLLDIIAPHDGMI